MTTELDTVTVVKLKKPSLYKVIMHNDDFTPMQFVIELLVGLFNKNNDEAVNLMWAIHNEGSAVIMITTKSIAEVKVAEAQKLAKMYGHPLQTTCEIE